RSGRRYEPDDPESGRSCRRREPWPDREAVAERAYRARCDRRERLCEQAHRLSSFCQRRSNPAHSTHVPTHVTVHYRWHPLFGRRLRTRRRVGWPDGEHLDCELSDGTIARIPLWMVDAVACATHSIGKPEVSVLALMDLRQLLNALDRPQGNA